MLRFGDPDAAIAAEAAHHDAGLDMEQEGGRGLQSACTSDSFQVTSSVISWAEGCYEATGDAYQYSAGSGDNFELGDLVAQPSAGSLPV